MNINDFLVKLFGSSNSQEEFEQIEHWKNEGLDNARSLQEMLHINKQTEDLKGYKSFNVEAALLNNMNQLEEESKVDSKKSSNTNSIKRPILIIASILFLSIVGYFTYTSLSIEEAVFYAETPGTEIIENGSEIHLNEGSFYTYKSTNNFLKLTGEAQFDVSKQDKPFNIETAHGTITVLGTKFNVKTSTDETSIYMHEGVIEFNKEGEKIQLSKGQFLKINGEQILSTDMNAQVISYWMNEKLDYKNVALTNVLDDINRLYNKSLKAQNVNSDEIFITSSFDGNSLEEIILILETISNVTIE